MAIPADAPWHQRDHRAQWQVPASMRKIAKYRPWAPWIASSDQRHQMARSARPDLTPHWPPRIRRWAACDTQPRRQTEAHGRTAGINKALIKIRASVWRPGSGLNRRTRLRPIRCGRGRKEPQAGRPPPAHRRTTPGNLPKSAQCCRRVETGSLQAWRDNECARWCPQPALRISLKLLCRLV